MTLVLAGPTTRTDALTAPIVLAATAPTVSVLVPCWNAERTMRRAVESVLAERDVDLECIVIDDGSTDDTGQIAQALAAQDPRVVVVSLPANVGVATARNVGLGIARGTWLAFVDADDRLTRGAIAALMEPTADPTVTAVIGQRIWTDGERTWLSRVYDIDDIRVPGRKSIAGNPGLLYYASLTGKLFHRSLAGGLTFYGRILGDQPWTIRSLLRADDGIEVLDRTVYEWFRPRPGDATQTITTGRLASATAAADMMGVAVTAYRDVAHEIDVQIGDATTSSDLKRAYFDRLVRSDIAEPLRRAVDRRDPDLDVLCAAIATFLDTIPADVLAQSEQLVPGILRPLGVRWHHLTRPTRSIFWHLLRSTTRVDPRLAVRPGARPLAPAIGLVRRSETSMATTVASWTLAVVSWGDAVRRRAGQIRRALARPGADRAGTGKGSAIESAPGSGQPVVRADASAEAGTTAGARV